MSKHDYAYFLNVHIPRESPLLTEANALDMIKDEINHIMEEQRICSFTSLHAKDKDYLILNYGCDTFGGVVPEYYQDELEPLLTGLSAKYPDFYFHLYAEDADDGDRNITYVFHDGQYREDYSILIDSALELEPAKAEQYRITCVLDELSLKKVKTLLAFIGYDFNIEKSEAEVG